MAVIGIAGCGPSSAEVKEARSARYTCEYGDVFKAAAETVKELAPPLGTANPEDGIIASDFRWHSSTGMRKEAGSAMIGEGDVGFQVELAIREAEGGGFTIDALPRIFAQDTGSPRGQELTRDHADWPEWADGKVDNIMIKIRERLSRCASSPSGGG